MALSRTRATPTGESVRAADEGEQMVQTMTERQRAGRIAALRRERETYEGRGLADRVEQVDAELARLGGTPEHTRRAERRPRTQGETR